MTKEPVNLTGFHNMPVNFAHALVWMAVELIIPVLEGINTDKLAQEIKIVERPSPE